MIEKTKESFPNCMPCIKVPIYIDKRNKNSKKQEKKKKYSQNKERAEKENKSFLKKHMKVKIFIFYSNTN